MSSSNTQVKPWALDAGEITDVATLVDYDLKGKPELFASTPFVSGPQIISGEKGTGKTLGLAKKCAILSKTEILCIPNSRPFRIEMSPGLLGTYRSKLESLSTPDYWKPIWLYACAGLACHKLLLEKKIYPFHDERKDEITRVFSNWGSPTSKPGQLFHQILEYVFATGVNTKELMRQYNQVMVTIIHESTNSIALFLDSIDEAIASTTVETGEVTNSSDAIKLRHVFSAQSALIDAIKELNGTFEERFKVFASVRSDAFDKYSGGVAKAQIKSLFCEITYSKEELLGIFRSHVRATEDRLLKNKKVVEEKEMEALFGVRGVYHITRFWEFEEMEKHILRYSLGRPRDLLLIGSMFIGIVEGESSGADSDGHQNSKIMSRKSSDRANITKVVREAAYVTFEDYKKFAPSGWRKDIEDFVFAKISHNVLTKEIVDKITREFKSSMSSSSDPFAFFYGMGLLGYPEKNDNDGGNFRQVFCELGNRSYDKALPIRPYYVLHPCLSQAVRKATGVSNLGDYSTSSFIIGPGLKCAAEFQTTPSVRLKLKNGKWDVEIEGIFNEELSKQSFHQPLFVGMLIAVLKYRRNEVSITEICGELKFLRNHGFFNRKIGNNGSYKAAPDFPDLFYAKQQENMEGANGSTQVNRIKEILRPIFGPKQNLKLKSDERNVKNVYVCPFDVSEIGISVPVDLAHTRTES